MQTSNSNVDSPSVSATTGELQNLADIIQSNTSRTSFSSPIHRLPTEILSEIFLYCLPEDEHLMYASRRAPMLLTRICRRWREVAVGLPMLWCRLQLEFWYEDWQGRALSQDDWPTRAFGYDSWLKRSAGCPLSLRLECGAHWNELQKLLQPYIRQISSLSLGFLSCHDPFMLEDFHALKELTIRKYMPDDPLQAINNSLSKLPVNLRKINTENMWFDRKQLNFFSDSAWARLTHIEIDVDGLGAITRILRLCPDLSSLKMVGMLHLVHTAESVTHTNLKSLCMSWSTPPTSAGGLGLFKGITLPNLRVLETSYTGPWPHEDFVEFLMRSKCPLEKLVLDSTVRVTSQQREEYAAFVPSN